MPRSSASYNPRRFAGSVLALVFSAVLLTGIGSCGGSSGDGGENGDSGNGSADPEPLFSISGSVTGLDGDGLTLVFDEMDQTLEISAGETAFSFEDVPDGSDYTLSAGSQPSGPNQSCDVENATGTVSGSDVEDVRVNCTTEHYTISGTITGLSSEDFLLSLNDGEQLLGIDSGTTIFEFEPIPDGSVYSIAIDQQPINPHQTCVVSNGSGEVDGGDVGDVAIECNPGPFDVGGNIAGLHNDGLTLSLNGGEQSLVLEAGMESFSFEERLADGSDYVVAIGAQPDGAFEQSCTISNESGTVAGDDVADISLACTVQPWQTRMHEGPLHARMGMRDVELNWEAGTGEHVLYMTTDPAADLLSPGAYGVDVVVNAQPEHRFDELLPGQAVYAALETDGVIRAWTAARPNVLGVEGVVRTMTRNHNDGTLYIGGSFSDVTVVTGGGVTVPVAGSGAGHVLAYEDVVASDLAIKTKQPDAIHAAVSDGAGGWYIGGRFDFVGGEPRENLAQIDAQGRVTDWDPGVDPSGTKKSAGTVYTLLLHEGVVYVGGQFNSAGQGSTGGGAQPRSNLAAFTEEGALRDWDPGVNGSVHALATTDGMIIAGGTFTSAGHGDSGEEVVTRERLAAFSAAGTVDDWDPGAGSTVNTIAASDGVIYVGGLFLEAGQGSTGGESDVRRRLAAFDLAGSLTDWDPGADHAINALAVAEGVIYAGGRFPSVGSGSSADEVVVRDRLAAFTADGAVTEWDPGVDRDFTSKTALAVNALAIDDGIIHAAGDFNLAGTGASADSPQSRLSLAAFTADGLLMNWDPGLSSQGEVNALAISNGVMYAAGHGSFGIGSSGGAVVEPRGGLAAFAVDGELTDWDPGANHTVQALVWENGVVYAGGSFTEAGSGSTGGGVEVRERLAAFGETGELMSWDPGANSTVEALAVEGGIVYAGGSFTAAGQGSTAVEELSRLRLAAFTPAGALTDWDPGVSSTVESLVVDGGVAYAGGRFTWAGQGSTGGGEESREHLAAFDLAGELTAWDPGLEGTIVQVGTMKANDGVIYIGGRFHTAGIGTTGGGMEARDNLAAVDLAGELSAWDPGANSTVHALFVDDGIIHVGGLFTSAGSGSTGGGMEARERLAAITTAGVLLDWAPRVDATVSTLLLADDLLHVGGSFGAAAGSGGLLRLRNSMAIIDSDGELIDAP